MVELRELTRENMREVMFLSVSDEQDEYVAPNAESIAEAAYVPQSWLRGIYADGEPVGLVLLAERPDEAWYYVWRFMVDQNHQRKGYGKRAMELVIEHVKTLPNASELFLTYIPGEHGPEHFYRSLGFDTTGKVKGGEHEMVLAL